jgi:hypothetical protein
VVVANDFVFSLCRNNGKGSLFGKKYVFFSDFYKFELKVFYSFRLKISEYIGICKKFSHYSGMEGVFFLKNKMVH